METNIFSEIKGKKFPLYQSKLLPTQNGGDTLIHSV